MKKKITSIALVLALSLGCSLACNIKAEEPSFKEVNTQAALATKDYTTYRLIERFSINIGDTWHGTFYEDGYTFVGTLTRAERVWDDSLGRTVYRYVAWLHGYSKGPVVEYGNVSQNS